MRREILVLVLVVVLAVCSGCAVIAPTSKLGIAHVPVAYEAGQGDYARPRFAVDIVRDTSELNEICASLALQASLGRQMTPEEKRQCRATSI